MKQASKEPLVSIIIPVYDVEPYLARCLDSVISQTYENLEIIVVDDGSTDNSGKICDEYAKKDKRIKVIHKENGGISDARNTGLKNTTGLFLTYIDPDDTVVAKYIEILQKSITNSHSDVAIAGHITKYPKKEYRHVYEKNSVLTGEEACGALLYDEGIDTSLWAKIYKTEIAKKHHFPKGQIFEDTAITGKILADSKKVSVIAMPIYYYNRRKKSITTKSFSKEKLDLIKSTAEMTDYVLEKYPELLSATRRRVLFSYLATLSQLAESREKDRSIKKTLLSHIKSMRRSALGDPRTPKRDKLAIMMTYLGYPLFRVTWSLYRELRGKV